MFPRLPDKFRDFVGDIQGLIPTGGVHRCTVTSIKDKTKRGLIEVSNGKLFPDGPESIRGATPAADLGGGFFQIPYVGATVLVVPTYDDQSSSPEYVWFACLWNEVAKRVEQCDLDASKPEESGMRHECNIPDYKSVYRHNDTPQKAIWKTHTGHKIELSDKVVFGNDNKDELVQEDHILIENITGQKILLDQGQGLNHDRIVITDGNNIIRMQRTNDFKIGENALQLECWGNMFLTSKTGQMYLNVDQYSESDIIIQNDGKGDVNVSSMQGNMSLYSSGTMDLESLTNITLKAPRIDLNPEAESLEQQSDGGGPYPSDTQLKLRRPGLKSLNDSTMKLFWETALESIRDKSEDNINRLETMDIFWAEALKAISR